ncbi:tRNA-guanine(15) transglycosylase [Halolamina pelagica]|uniref:tRNA-guanine(15) transglycosylase n=1 Tax=Halolamina pelagica TaxID=699431 RepID=A0A0N8HZH6_9EURY|nr:tRNA-guanine(15) transglycosylase [Halolamina pelagica]
MRDAFEIRASDGMARVGRLTVPRAGVTVETPALMPVVNPNLQTISPGDSTTSSAPRS